MARRQLLVGKARAYDGARLRKKTVKSRRPASPAPRAPVGTLERGLAVLQFFKTAREASVAELAAALKLSRSTAYRIAERLRELGFLEVASATGRWRLGREAVQIGVAAVQSTEIMQVAPERLQRLLDRARESVNLAVFDTDSMLLLYREQGPQSVTISARLGSRRPMHASALGKAYLAAMQESERKVLIGRLVLRRHTPTTIATAAALEREAGEIRKRGYSVDRGEFEPTLACCAAAVFDHRGMPVAAISASGPAERVVPQIDEIGRLVAATAAEISQRLGFLPRK